MRIFISGIGMNGKTRLLDDLFKEEKINKKFSRFSIDTRGLLDFLSTSKTKLSSVPDLVSEYKLNAYKCIPDDVISDRSLIDQICISSGMDFSNYGLTDYDRLLNEFGKVVNDDDVFILLWTNPELVFSSNNDCDHRSWVYKTKEDYDEAQNNFVDLYLDLAYTYFPSNSTYLVHINDWSEMQNVKSLINSIIEG